MSDTFTSARRFGEPYAVFSAIIGLLSIFILSVGAYQLGRAYVSGEGLDANTAELLVDAMMFFLIAYAAARQLHLLLSWLGLRQRAKKLFVIAEYELNDISPAEAGTMLDTFSGKTELIATLRSLEHKGCITITQVGDTFLLSRQESAAAPSSAGLQIIGRRRGIISTARSHAVTIQLKITAGRQGREQDPQAHCDIRKF